MNMPLSVCDIGARYGQAPAPQKTVEGQAGWDLGQTFRNYLLKVRRQNQQAAKEAEEDALMAVIDAMNASEEDKRSGRLERTLTKSLADAGKSIAEQHEEVQEDGTRQAEWVDPSLSLTIQVLLSCAGDRFTFEQADEVRENAEESLEKQRAGEESRNVTEKRSLSDTGDPEEL